jgi:hypothetical protein
MHLRRMIWAFPALALTTCTTRTDGERLEASPGYVIHGELPRGVDVQDVLAQIPPGGFGVIGDPTTGEVAMIVPTSSSSPEVVSSHFSVTDAPTCPDCGISCNDTMMRTIEIGLTQDSGPNGTPLRVQTHSSMNFDAPEHAPSSWISSVGSNVTISTVGTLGTCATFSYYFDVVECGAADDCVDNGDVSLVWSQANDDPPSAFVIGQVYDILEPGVSAVDFAQPGGVDDCALTLYTLEDLQMGTLPTYDHLSAGTLTVASGGSAVEIDPTGANLVYYVEIEPDAIAFGGTYEVDAPGDSFPGFSGEIEMPPMRELIAPAPDFSAAGALTVQWSGGDPDQELLLRLEGMNTEGDRALVICRVENDGEHTVPEAIIDEFPSGRLSVHLQQQVRNHALIGDRAVRLNGSVVHIVVGSAP